MSEETFELIEKYKETYSVNEWSIAQKLLNNCYKYVTAGGSMHNPQTLDGFIRITDKIIRRLLILSNILGIQPMEGPIGRIFCLDYTEQADNKLYLSLFSDAIEARLFKCSKPLQVHSIVDKISDIVLNEFSQNLADQYSEILIGYLKENAYRADSVNTSDVFNLIGKESKHISRRSHRGIGNYLIISSDNMKILFPEWDESSTSKLFLSSQKIIIDNLYGIKILISEYIGDDILIGYKGQSDLDTSMVFSPYVLCMSSGIIDDEMVGMLSRFGLWGNKDRCSKYCTVFKLNGDINV